MQAPETGTSGLHAPSALERAPIPAASWLSLVLLTITYAIYTLDRFIVAIVIEPLKRDFDLNDSQVGLLTGVASTLPYLLTCIPLSMLADRISRKWMLIVLLVLWSACTGLGGLATSLGFLVAARVAVAALEAGFTPAAMSILTDKFPPRRRPTAMGLFSLGTQFGVFLALGVGGMVAAEYGWRWAFFIAGIPGIVMGVVLALFEREPPRGVYDRPNEAISPVRSWPIKAALVGTWRAPLAFYSACGLILCALLSSAAATWMPSLLIRVYKFDVQDAGFAAAIIGLAGAAGTGVSGILADWIGPPGREWRKFLVPIGGSLVAVVVGVAALLFTSNASVAVGLLGVMTFFHTFYAGTAYAFILGNTAPALRSTVLAVVLIGSNVISTGLGNMLVGIVSDAMQSWAGADSLAFSLATVLLFTTAGALVFGRAMVLARRSGAEQRRAGSGEGDGSAWQNASA